VNQLLEDVAVGRAARFEFWLPLPEEEEDDPLPQPAPPAEAPPARGASRFAPPPRVVEAEVVESLQPAEEVWVAGAAAEAVASNDAELQREGEVADAAAAAGWMQALEQRSWRNLKYQAAGLPPPAGPPPAHERPETLERAVAAAVAARPRAGTRRLRRMVVKQHPHARVTKAAVRKAAGVARDGARARPASAPHPVAAP
jgi:hypothetical protein